MKTFILLLITSVVSCAAFYGTLNGPNALAGAAVALAAWAIFILHLSKRSRRLAERKEMEQFFRRHMRNR